MRKFRLIGNENSIARFFRAVNQYRDAFWQDKPFKDHGFLVSMSGGGEIGVVDHADQDSNCATYVNEERARDILEITKALATAAGCEMISIEENHRFHEYPEECEVVLNPVGGTVVGIKQNGIWRRWHTRCADQKERDNQIIQRTKNTGFEK